MPTSREPRWLTSAEMRAWRALLRGTSLLFDRLDEELNADHRLSLSEYEVLVVLNGKPDGLRMGELADTVLVSRSRMTHTCNRMERDGLVERTAHHSDKRGLVATITALGRKRLAEAAPDHVEGVRRWFLEGLKRDQLDALSEVMEHALRRLDAEVDPPDWPGTLDADGGR